MKRMSRSAKAAIKAFDVSGEGGTGLGNGSTSVIAHWPRTPLLVRRSCSRSAHSLGAGGHLYGAPHTPTRAWPLTNVGRIARKAVGARDRVEFVCALEPRRRRHVVVGAQRDHEMIALVDASVGRHAAGSGIDRGDRLPLEAHSRLGELRVREAHRVEGRPAEHHVELRIAEDEGVALVDDRHLGFIAQRLRQDRARAPGRRIRRPAPECARSWLSPLYGRRSAR